MQGTSLSLSAHNSKEVSEHLILVQRSVEHREKNRTKELQALKDEVDSEALKRDITSCKESFDMLQGKLVSHVDHAVQAVVKVESAIQQLQDGFGEMALLVQTLQATSYSGVFVWKIPEVKRRRQEAKMGRTISLYSAPFYTSRHGYKLCLRLYMDGDGSGKGSHLSFSLTVMRGEFDSLLQWPFKQTVSLMLLDQDWQRDIIQSFRPEPSSAATSHGDERGIWLPQLCTSLCPGQSILCQRGHNVPQVYYWNSNHSHDGTSIIACSLRVRMRRICTARDATHAREACL